MTKHAHPPVSLARRWGSLLMAVMAASAVHTAHAQVEIADPPAGHNFGRIPLAATYAAQYFSVFNRGNAPVTLGAAAVDGQMGTCAALGCPVVAPADFLVQVGSDGCSGRTLAAGEGCSTLLIFSPKAPGGRTARLTFAVAGAAPLNFILGGTGVADPTDCVLDWAERQLPSVLTSPTPTFTTGPFYARCYGGGTVCIGADAAAVTAVPASVYIYQNGALSRYAFLAQLAALGTHAPPSTLACDQPRPQP